VVVILLVVVVDIRARVDWIHGRPVGWRGGVRILGGGRRRDRCRRVSSELQRFGRQQRRFERRRIVRRRWGRRLVEDLAG
jgi:hypothetical protein